MAAASLFFLNSLFFGDFNGILPLFTFPEADTMAAVMWQTACSPFLAFSHSHFTCQWFSIGRQGVSGGGGRGRGSGSDGCDVWSLGPPQMG